MVDVARDYPGPVDGIKIMVDLPEQRAAFIEAQRRHVRWESKGRHLEVGGRQVTGQQPGVGRPSQPTCMLSYCHDVRVADHLLGKRDRRREGTASRSEPLHH